MGGPARHGSCPFPFLGPLLAVVASALGDQDMTGLVIPPPLPHVKTRSETESTADGDGEMLGRALNGHW